MENTIAVILAGGRGKRLKPLTDNTPKPLLTVAGKTFLEHALDIVRAAGIKETIVVGGYMIDTMRDFVKNIDDSITVLEADWQMQNLDGFQLTLPHLKGKNVFILNADYVFTPENIEKTANGFSDVPLAFCSYDLSGDDDDVMTVHEEDGQIMAMSKTLTEFESIYTGMLYIPEAYTVRMIDMVNELLTHVDKTAVSVERILLEFSKEGVPVKVSDIGKSNWVEVDTTEELERARQQLSA